MKDFDEIKECIKKHHPIPEEAVERLIEQIAMLKAEIAYWKSEVNNLRDQNEAFKHTGPFGYGK